MKPLILFEDKSIIVCIKPPKLPVQSDRTGDMDLLTTLTDYMIREKNFENPYLGLVHRLDRPVGGLLVFSKNKYVTSDLSKQLQARTFKKTYYAVVNGRPDSNKTLNDYLKKKANESLSRVVDEDVKGAKKAILHYKVLESIHHEDYGDLTLLAVALETGRHHQIRVQLAHDGFPIWGDTKYNKHFQKQRGWHQIALWAYSLSFKHPKTKKQVDYQKQPDDILPFNLFKLG